MRCSHSGTGREFEAGSATRNPGRRYGKPGSSSGVAGRFAAGQPMAWRSGHDGISAAAGDEEVGIARGLGAGNGSGRWVFDFAGGGAITTGEAGSRSGLPGPAWAQWTGSLLKADGGGQCAGAGISAGEF